MIVLSPLHQIIVPAEDPTAWESTGIDPYFSLPIPHAALGKGWLRLRLSGDSEAPRNLKLYLDTGCGYNERETLAIGQLTTYRTSIVQYFHLPSTVRSLRLDAGEIPGRFHLECDDLRCVHTSRVNLRVLRTLANRALMSRNPLSKAWNCIRAMGLRMYWHNLRQQALYHETVAPMTQAVPYRPLSDAQIRARAETLQAEISLLQQHPVISLLVPVYNPDPSHLLACIESVKTQLYPHWQLCLADDHSTDPRIRPMLEQAAASDRRITVIWRETNGHICHATNSALAAATGSFVGLLDNDDLLTPDALLRVAHATAMDPTIDYLYSDEDKTDGKGRFFEPFYKPEWLPDLLCGVMYTSHFSVYRTTLIREIGGFRPGFEGSQDHDLCLRATERARKVVHLPHILYHWRVHRGSTAACGSAKSYADVAGLKAVQEALVRRGEGGMAEGVPNGPGRYYTRYPIHGSPLVSILIPTRDNADILEGCLASLFARTTYQNFEVIVIDNGSVQERTFALFERFETEQGGRFRVERHDIPFNFSRLNNLGAASARGEFILMLNNDTEVISPTWLEEMLGWAQRPSIGVVGAMLLFPDRTIQHAGVILGIGGVAGHSHKYLPIESGGYFGRLMVPSPYSAVTAACLLVRRSVFEQVGGLEESLTVAFNDVDFCCKVHRLGLQGIVPPLAQLFHYESKSRGAEDDPIKQARFTQETSFMRQRWSSLLDADPAYHRNLSSTHEDFRLAEEQR